MKFNSQNSKNLIMTHPFLYLSNVLKIKDKDKDEQVKIRNEKLQKVVQNYNFYDISAELDINQTQEIKQNIDKSDIIIINQYQISKNVFIIIFF